MESVKRLLACVALFVPLLALEPVPGQAEVERDGQHDFDFSFGTWRTQVSVRARPLSGSDEWFEYEGTSIVRPLWDGKANMVELDVAGPAGRIEGLNLRLYNPGTRQWNLNYANVNRGTMGSPMVGEFRNGRGLFFSQITLEGRAVDVRFEITQEAPNAWRYLQSFSDDGGRTWEVNWNALDTLVAGPAGGSVDSDAMRMF